MNNNYFGRRRKKKNKKAEQDYNESLWKAYPKKKDKDEQD